MNWNEPGITKARHVIFHAAKDMLAGKLTYIEGTREIVAAWWASKLDENDPDFLPFVGINSETEALPLGEIRAHWQRAALEAQQSEIDHVEIWARQYGEPYCRNLVTRFSSGALKLDVSS